MSDTQDQKDQKDQKDQIDQTDKFEVLRWRAEELIRQRHDVNKDFPTEILELIHELRIHQAELEIQNQELKRAQIEISDLHHEFEDLYDFAPCGYVTLNSKKIITRINLCGAILLGRLRQQIINTGFSNYIAAEDENFYYKALRKSGETGKKQSPELKIKTDKKPPVWVRADIQADRTTDEEVIQWRMVLVDITESKAMEAQLQQSRKMESIGILAGGIAHDFNNILYIIIGNAELALDDIPESNPVHDSIKNVMSAGLRGSEIVKQLLNFSRKSDQEFQSIDAVLIIKAALKFFRSLIPANVKIHMNFKTQKAKILADSSQITQVLMNICINASQAMEETGGVIEINLENEFLPEGYLPEGYLIEESVKKYPNLYPGNYLKITIRDTGPGIEPEIINRIFDPYFTTKEFGKGSGMGLAVVHGIVKNHNGVILVDSQPGKGSCFTLLFPIIKDKPSIESEKQDEIPTGSERILFIDDEKKITDLVQKMLEKLGYQVEAKQNSLEALELFKSKPQEFDLVISDMTMPNMSGIKLFEKMKEIRFDIPVIICTGHSPLIDEKKAETIGIAAYVMKPVRMQKLAESIRKVLDKV